MRPVHYVPAHDGRLRRMLAMRSVPGHVILATAAASYVGIIIAVLMGWPLWARVLFGLLPWIPLFTVEMAWTYTHYTWLALFFVLTVTQVGHVFEHVAQMVQIHVLGLSGPAARGIFGALDIEWVHFGWNTWVLLAVVALLIPYHRNPWLWATLVLAGWHEAEHVYIISQYLRTGEAGNPGLLAHGGLLFGGLSFTRPDLHMIYNGVETAPLVLAFVYQLRRVHDQWLAKSLPRLPQGLLLDVTRRAEVVRVAPRDVIISEGERPDRFYAVVRGRLEVSCLEEDGSLKVVGTLGPGGFFGENVVTDVPCKATVRALTRVELLAVDREAMRHVATHYRSTGDELGGTFSPAAA